MSACGKCRNSVCTCVFMGDGSTTQVIGLGTSFRPFQVRPITPSYRPLGVATRTTSLTVPINTDVVIPFTESDVPISSTVDMWNVGLPTRLTAPISGLYMIGGYAALNGDMTNFLWITKNGVVASPLVKRTTKIQSGGYHIYNDVVTLIRLVANDYIELYIRTDDATSIALTGGVASPGTNFGAGPYIWASWMDE